MIFDTLLLQADAGGAGMSQLLIIGAMFVVFYFFLIRPQSKRQKEQKNFSESLDKGQEVVTASGIIGKITKMEDEIVTLEVGTKVYIRVTRNAISKEMTDALFGSSDKK
ncbi:MAG: preprotein translocase subunit YajC [Saprospiraceae bacterium]|nr:preprotein translocase subunit YajC [Saprospiraceae bacterium]